MRIWRRDPDDEPPISSVLILLDTLSPAERRDLANSLLLRAAWSAALEQTRVMLLDVRGLKGPGKGRRERLGRCGVRRGLLPEP
jgi:hypothetical protein